MSSMLPLMLRTCGRARAVCVISRPQASQQQKQRPFSTGAQFPCWWFKRYQEKQRKEFWTRRREVGPEPMRHRDIWPNWNYDAEIFAFGARLGEATTSATFRQAFIHESFTRQEKERRKELQIDEQLQMTSSSKHQGELKKIGDELIRSYVPAICRFNMPYFPEEGIQALLSHVMQTENLAEISRHLGTSDLIQCAEMPPYEETLADTLLAIIGALKEDFNLPKAQNFILDFVVITLLNADVNDLFQPNNPMGVVADIIQREGRAEPESRLLRQCGAESPEAVFLIGIYSDKELIGQSFGETLLIAEEMAARDTLRRFFRTTINKRPFLFGDRAKNINLSVWSKTPNLRLAEWTHSGCRSLLDSRLSNRSLLQEGPEGSERSEGSELRAHLA